MRQQINLYQPTFRKEARRLSSRAIIKAGAILLAGIVFLFVINVWQISRLRENVDKLDRQFTLVTQRLQTVSATLKERPKNRALEQEVRRMEQLIEARHRVQAMLKEGAFSNTQGFSPYFVAFARQRVNGLWLTGFEITGAGENMTLNGRTSNPELVPRFLQKLAGEQVLSGTQFKVFRVSRPVTEKTKRPKPYIEFVVSTREGDADEAGMQAPLAWAESGGKGSGNP